MSSLHAAIRQRRKILPSLTSMFARSIPLMPGKRTRYRSSLKASQLIFCSIMPGSWASASALRWTQISMNGPTHLQDQRSGPRDCNEGFATQLETGKSSSRFDAWQSVGNFQLHVRPAARDLQNHESSGPCSNHLARRGNCKRRVSCTFLSALGALRRDMTQNDGDYTPEETVSLVRQTLERANADWAGKFIDRSGQVFPYAGGFEPA